MFVSVREVSVTGQPYEQRGISDTGLFMVLEETGHVRWMSGGIITFPSFTTDARKGSLDP